MGHSGVIPRDEYHNDDAEDQGLDSRGCGCDSDKDWRYLQEIERATWTQDDRTHEVVIEGTHVC